MMMILEWSGNRAFCDKFMDRLNKCLLYIQVNY